MSTKNSNVQRIFAKKIFFFQYSTTSGGLFFSPSKKNKIPSEIKNIAGVACSTCLLVKIVHGDIETNKATKRDAGEFFNILTLKK